jgi:hypothetical protein
MPQPTLCGWCVVRLCKSLGSQAKPPDMSHSIVVVDRDPEAMPWTARAVDQPNTLGITEPIRLELVRVPAGKFLMDSQEANDRKGLCRAEL